MKRYIYIYIDNMIFTDVFLSTLIDVLLNIDKSYTQSPKPLTLDTHAHTEEALHQKGSGFRV